jgi:transcriptional regulator GlxA family with amidase domain
LRLELVASVRTGSLLLAAAGLLADKQATTHWAYRRVLEHLGATPVRGRWVQDGKFVSAGGTPDGIDMALTLVARQKDERTARRVQLWIEYDPQPSFGRPTYDTRNVPRLQARPCDPGRSAADR